MEELKTGHTLQNGKYAIVKTLGSGTFGITYLATVKTAVNGQLGRMNVTVNVAIKEFYMHNVNSRGHDGSSVEGTQNTMAQNYRHKFRKEAENLSKLHHPNIVKVVDVFDENNTTYYVMEHIAGGTLDSYILTKGRLAEGEAAVCTMTIGAALAYMHAHRMVHLDLKPSNVMRATDGHIYLIDFGLSKQYDTHGEPESSTSIGLGTPGYAPIEQASYKQDGTVPVTLDLYALGATLFKMLTGQTPPEASAILNDGFPLASLQRADVSQSMADIVEKAMAPMRKARYQSVDDMLAAVAPFAKNARPYSTAAEATSYNEPIPATVDEDDYPQGNGGAQGSDDSQRGDDSQSGGSGIADWLKQHPVAKVALFIVAAIVLFIIVFPTQYLYDDTPTEQAEEMTQNTQPQKAPNPDGINLSSKEVDLGLPSGTVWAGWNIGATTADQVGDRFAWGESSGKSIASLRETGKSDYFDDTFTKITLKSNPCISGTVYDIALEKWGDSWRMPTRQQVEELITSCEWKTYTYYGKEGVLGTGPNGRHIFLPYTGYANKETIFEMNVEGDYWIGELCNPNEHDHSSYDPDVVPAAARRSERANMFDFHADGYGNKIPIVDCSPRKLGYAVRAVKKR